MFGIWCKVWGGVTGLREVWLKENGVMVEFSNRIEAEKVAAGLTQDTMGDPNRTANFEYTVREFARLPSDWMENHDCKQQDRQHHYDAQQRKERQRAGLRSDLAESYGGFASNYR